ncbi:MAG: AAA family ATPase [bacterium]|nr:AAA family ATPase [bacterium]
MPKIYITGVSGVGKTTLAGELNKRGILAYDVDSVPGLCHWRNKETKEKADYEYGIGKEWLMAHDWIADEEQLRHLLGNAETVVVLGLTGNQKQYFQLFDTVYLLQCPPEVFLKRIDVRIDNDFGKEKSEQEHILSWYEGFEKRLIDQGVFPIDATQSIAEIADRVMSN